MSLERSQLPYTKAERAQLTKVFEDTSLPSESQESELRGARCKPRVKKGYLALSKEERKEEGQNSHPLLIKYTATT